LVKELAKARGFGQHPSMNRRVMIRQDRWPKAIQRAVLLLAVVAALAMGWFVVSVALREIREHRLIRDLTSPERTVRRDAALQLADLKSVAAIPHLVELFRVECVDQSRWRKSSGGFRRAPATEPRLHYSAQALARIGGCSAPALVELCRYALERDLYPGPVEDALSLVAPDVTTEYLLDVLEESAGPLRMVIIRALSEK
jgi:HEAT repeat protein